MGFRIGCFVLFLLQQLGSSQTRDCGKNEVFLLQQKIENFVQKVLSLIDDYRHHLTSETKCIPNDLPDKIFETIKNSIDCIKENDQSYQNSKIGLREHQKAFMKCFGNAKKQVEEVITKIDKTEDNCPENQTVKSYQVNITTTYTKTFDFVINNGVEITNRTLHEEGVIECGPRISDEEDERDGKDDDRKNVLPGKDAEVEKLKGGNKVEAIDKSAEKVKEKQDEVKNDKIRKEDDKVVKSGEETNKPKPGALSYVLPKGFKF